VVAFHPFLRPNHPLYPPQLIHREMGLKNNALSIIIEMRGLYALMSCQSDGILQPCGCGDPVGQPCGPSLHLTSDAANGGD
jgi:hypothetical protein